MAGELSNMDADRYKKWLQEEWLRMFMGGTPRPPVNLLGVDSGSVLNYSPPANSGDVGAGAVDSTAVGSSPNASISSLFDPYAGESMSYGSDDYDVSRALLRGDVNPARVDVPSFSPNTLLSDLDTGAKISADAMRREDDNIYRDEDSRTSYNPVGGSRDWRSIFDPYGGGDIGSESYLAARDFASLGDRTGFGRAMGIMGGVGHGLQALLDIGKNVVSGIGDYNMSQQLIRSAAQRRRMASNMTNTLADGGDTDGDSSGVYLRVNDGIYGPSSMTGEYAYALPKSMQDMASAEIEGGEYVLPPNDLVREAKGEKHTRGGMPIDPEEGTRVLSDRLGPNAETLKAVKDLFGIPVSKGNSYSTLMDRYKTKIGLKKVYSDMEKLYKRLDKNDNITDDNTRRLNEMVLAKDLNEAQGKIESMSGNMERFFNYLYEAQQRDKDVEYDQYLFGEGGKVTKEALSAACEKYGIKEDAGKALIRGEFKKRGLLPVFADGTGDVRINNVTPVLLRRQVGGEERGELSFLTEEQYRDLSNRGINTVSDMLDPKNHSIVAETMGWGSGDFTGFREYLNDKGLGSGDLSIGVYSASEEPVDTTDTQTVTPDKGAISPNEQFDKYGYWVDDYGRKQYVHPDKKIDDAIDSNQINNNQRGVTDGDYSGELLFPNYLRNAPSPPLFNSLKQVSNEEISPVLVNPDNEVREINRVLNSQINSLDGLADSQKQALIANMSAVAQSNVQRAYDRASQVNRNAVQQALNYNVQSRNNQQAMNNQLRQQYEDDVLRTLTNQELAESRYAASINNEIAQKANARNTVNTLNSMFPDIRVGPDGRLFYYSNDDVLSLVNNNVNYNTALSAANEAMAYQRAAQDSKIKGRKR